MIYYFSGTGNSRYIANYVAKLTNDKVYNILSNTCIPCKDDCIGLVFPVHAWSAPRVMEEFIDSQLRKLILHEQPYIYMIATCGDDIGKTQEILQNKLSRIGLKLTSAFSLIMPDSYIGLPGFDVNNGEIERQKIQDSLKLLPSISNDILNRKATTRTKPGPFPWTKSFVLRPLFYKFFTGTKLFSSNDLCIHCEKCAKICPTKNITIVDGHPQWQNNCTNCLACYHVCPKHSIIFGKFSKNKGQYQLLLHSKEEGE